MKLTYINQGDVRINFLEGRLDLPHSVSVENKITEVLKNGFSKLIFDLGKLEYLGSSGLRLFISLTKRLRNQQGRVVFCSLSPSIRNLIEIAELQSQIEIYPDLSKALQSFGNYISGTCSMKG